MRRTIRLLRELSAAMLFGLFAVLAPAAAAEPPSRRAAEPPADRCAELAGSRWSDLSDANTWITAAVRRPATDRRPEVCEVEGYVNPQVFFGMYLPVDHWNGEYVFRGCGGSCGTVWTDGACAQHARDGYACIMTDMGHRSGQIDNNWTANNLQGQEGIRFSLDDFGTGYPSLAYLRRL